MLTQSCVSNVCVLCVCSDRCVSPEDLVPPAMTLRPGIPALVASSPHYSCPCSPLAISFVLLFTASIKHHTFTANNYAVYDKCSMVHTLHTCSIMHKARAISTPDADLAAARVLPWKVHTPPTSLEEDKENCPNQVTATSQNTPSTRLLFSIPPATLYIRSLIHFSHFPLTSRLPFSTSRLPPPPPPFPVSISLPPPFLYRNRSTTLPKEARPRRASDLETFSSRFHTSHQWHLHLRLRKRLPQARATSRRLHRRCCARRSTLLHRLIRTL